MKILVGLVVGFLHLLRIEASFRGNRFFEGPQRDGSYSFSYSVMDESSGNNYGHEESRLGTDTSGEYHVLLPDGRMQTVRYNVDPYTGYRAFVSYEGKSSKPRPLPSFIKDNLRPLESIRRDPTILRPPKNFPRPAASSPVYKPVNYSPAHLDYPQRPVINLIVPEGQRHRPFYAPAPSHIKPLNPNKKDKKAVHHKKSGRLRGGPPKEDPYLATEEELRGRDFSGPFFYPKHRKITKEGTKKDDGRKKKKKHHF